MENKFEELKRKYQEGTSSEEDNKLLTVLIKENESLGLQMDIEELINTLINRARQQQDLADLRNLSRQVVSELSMKEETEQQPKEKYLKIRKHIISRAAGAKKKKDNEESINDN